MVSGPWVPAIIALSTGFLAPDGAHSQPPKSPQSPASLRKSNDSFPALQNLQNDRGSKLEVSATHVAQGTEHLAATGHVALST